MSKTLDMLMTRRSELVAEIDELKMELGSVDAAIAGIKSYRPDRLAQADVASPSFVTANVQQPTKMTISDGLLESMRNGCGTSEAMEKFLIKHLGIVTTRNTIQTTLSRLKNSGKVARDGDRWALPEQNTPSDVAASEGG